MIAPDELRAVIDEVEAAGAVLRGLDEATLVERVAEAWGRIADPERALGRRAREELPGSTGLTLPVVAWALGATFEGFEDRIRDAVVQMRPPEGAALAPHRLGALVLAGNVFTACVKPLTFALLARTPLVVKASSKDDALPRLFADALRDVDPELAAACRVVTFPGGSQGLEATLFARPSVVSAYGSDATLESIRARLPAHATFLGHGHGLGVAYVAADALDGDVFARLAVDIAAYDQRGCLSPHAVLVERGATDLDSFAGRLADALDALDATMPRGVLPPGVGPGQIQWRGVAATQGRLFERSTSAVAVAPDGDAVRPSPGYRNVRVHAVADVAGLAARLDALGPHLKCLGVAGDRDTVCRALPPSVVPRVCPVGQMQRPSLTSIAEGRRPWEGFVRWLGLHE